MSFQSKNKEVTRVFRCFYLKNDSLNDGKNLGENTLLVRHSLKTRVGAAVDSIGFEAHISDA